MPIKQKEKQLEIIQQKKAQPRTAVLKLVNIKHKGMMLRNVHELKGSGIFLNKDFNRKTNNFRKEL